MYKRLAQLMIAVLAVVGLIAAGAAPANAGATKVSILFTIMTGEQEAPVPGDPDGFGSFLGVAKGDHLCYVLTARRIEPATAAHIHVAPKGEPGPVVVPLQAPTDGHAVECTTVDRELLDAIVADPSAYYVNVHNEEFGDGAIRGQLH